MSTARSIAFRAKLAGKGVASPLGSESYNPGMANHNLLTFSGVVADAQTVTIGGVVYEFDTAVDPGAITVGNLRVNVVAAQTAAAAATALAAAINANVDSRVDAIDLGSAVLIYSTDLNDATAHACSETCANGAWLATAMFGASAAAPTYSAVISRVPTAAEVTLDAMYFVLPFWARDVSVKVHVTSSKDVKAWNGATTITEGAVTVVKVDNSSTTDFATTDTVTVFARG